MNKKVGQQQGKQNCTNRPNIKKGQQTELGVLLQEPWGQKLQNPLETFTNLYVHIANNGGSYSRMSLVRSLGLGEMGVSLPDGRCSSEVSTDNSYYIQKVKCNLLWVVCSRP